MMKKFTIAAGAAIVLAMVILAIEHIDLMGMIKRLHGAG
jgi:hypothetical protein